MGVILSTPPSLISHPGLVNVGESWRGGGLRGLNSFVWLDLIILFTPGKNNPQSPWSCFRSMRPTQKFIIIMIIYLLYLQLNLKSSSSWTHVVVVGRSTIDQLIYEINRKKFLQSVFFFFFLVVTIKGFMKPYE